MEKQKTREEIEEQYKWDLSTIFKSDDDFKNELEAVKKEVESVSDYKGNIVSSANNLYKYLTESDLLERRSISQSSSCICCTKSQINF